MFGSLKKLFSKPEPAPVEPKVQPPVSAPAPIVAKPPESKPPTPAASPTQKQQEGVSLAFEVVKSRFSPNLSGLIKNPPGQPLVFPKGRIIAALSTGMVKVTFAEIKQASPPGTFLDTTGHDAETVELPLADVLKALPSGALPRRQGQSRVTPSSEVGDIFGPKGVALHQPVPAADRPWPERETSTPAIDKTEPAPPVPTPQATPVPEPPRPAISPKPLALDLPAAGLPTPPVASSRPEAAGLTTNQQPETIPFQAPKLDSRPTISFGNLPKIEPKPQPLPIPVPLPTQPSSGFTLDVPVAQVFVLWPDAIKAELIAHSPSASVSLPMEKVEQTMKTGKVVFPYREVVAWLRPAFTSSLPDFAAQSVEFPLSVVAPMFLAKNRQPRQQKKTEIGENIPNLFSSAPAPLPVSALPAETTASPSAVPKNSAKAAEEWGPQEVVQQSVILPGVAGALVCSIDGLPVASQLPPSVKKEIASAFLSQMFIRAAESARHLHAGELGFLVLHLGNTPWLILKTPNSYYVAIGKPGEDLPLQQLKQLAALLSSQPK
ncbi:MAG: hypothetical protein JWN25_3137 [Verrucomicrobiales bacterium]|nr:hypothetical protein [Verrucomicrobiales bacterium]